MWLHHRKPCCVCSCCIPLLASGCPWKMSLEVQQWFSHNGLCYICFLVKQKGQLTSSLLTSLGISGGAVREWGGVGEPQLDFVIYSVLCTSFWDSTWRQLGARHVMVTNIRITHQDRLDACLLSILLWEQAILGLWGNHNRNSASLVFLPLPVPGEACIGNLDLQEYKKLL